MPMVDPFTPNAFSLTSLTAAINNLPYVPGRIGQLGWFQEAGLPTLTAMIEEQDGVISVVSPSPRNAPGQPMAPDGARRVRPFAIPHLQQSDAVYADEVQGVRAFGSENQSEVLQTRINEKLAQMRANIDYTLEYHRMLAVQGSYIDVNGDTQSLFTEFNVVQQTQSMALSASASSKAREKAYLVLEDIENALGGVPYSGVRVLCSPGFWKALIEDKDAKETYLNTQMASALRNDPRLVFDWNGFTWERYRGTSLTKITDDCAYAVPEGVPGLFLTRFAPANYIETVNTIGAPYYAKGVPMEMNKGWKLEAQSNPLNLCTRPRAVVKLTIS